MLCVGNGGEKIPWVVKKKVEKVEIQQPAREECYLGYDRVYRGVDFNHAIMQSQIHFVVLHLIRCYSRFHSPRVNGGVQLHGRDVLCEVGPPLGSSA